MQSADSVVFAQNVLYSEENLILELYTPRFSWQLLQLHINSHVNKFGTLFIHGGIKHGVG